jgi:hypothetical protein
MRKAEDDSWESTWARRLEEAKKRVDIAEARCWSTSAKANHFDNPTVYELARKSYTEERDLAMHEAKEARLDRGERYTEYHNLLETKKEERRTRDAVRAQEDADRKKKKP